MSLRNALLAALLILALHTGCSKGQAGLASAGDTQPPAAAGVSAPARGGFKAMGAVEVTFTLYDRNQEQASAGQRAVVGTLAIKMARLHSYQGQIDPTRQKLALAFKFLPPDSPDLSSAWSLKASSYIWDTDITAASYQFDLTVGTTTTGVSVTIASGDDNATAMQKVVDAIRSSSAAVTADLITVDPNTDTKKIVVSSTESGTANLIASVADTSGTLMADLGLAGTSEVGDFSANTTVEAQDATFTLDGIPMTSSVKSNSSGNSLSIAKASPNNTSVSSSADTKTPGSSSDNDAILESRSIDNLRSRRDRQITQLA